MSAVSVLVADHLAGEGIRRLEEVPGVSVTVRPGLGEAELAEAVREHDGMIVRSGVRVTQAVLAEPGRLRAIARAGVGVDNIDLDAATRAGIVVLNTPDANTLSTAEHAWALLLAAARRIPQADAHVRSGQWERKAFVGRQLAGKTLGVIGLGRIGRAVARRALGMEMSVIACDPFVARGAAIPPEIVLVDDVGELMERSDFVTIHAALTEETRGLINEQTLSRARPGIILVNCARGAIVDEAALARALHEGRVAAAGIDVFAHEPPVGSPLLEAPNVVLTPHLGASTVEAQRAVAIDAVDALLGYLLRGEIRGAVNLTGWPAALTDRQRRFLDLATRLGMLLSVRCRRGIRRVSVEVHGAALEPVARALLCQAAAALLSRHVETPLNPVSVVPFAAQRGIDLQHAVRSTDEGAERITITAHDDEEAHAAAGTILEDQLPRVVLYDGYRMDMVPEGPMVIVQNEDRPGVIGRIGTAFGRHGVNIADMFLSRRAGQALMVIKVDEAPAEEMLDHLLAEAPTIQHLSLVMLPPLRDAGAGEVGAGV